MFNRNKIILVGMSLVGGLYSMEIENKKSLALEEKVYTEKQDSYGRTQLHYIAIDSNKDVYHDEKLSLNLRTKRQNARNNFLAINYQQAQSLLQAQADPNAQDYEGNTPLYYAVINNNRDLINLLVSAHADWAIENNNGINCKDAAEILDYSVILFKKKDEHLAINSLKNKRKIPIQ